MKSKHQFFYVLFAISAIGYFPFSQWMSTTQNGTTFFLWCQIFYGFALIAAVLSIPVLSVLVFFKHNRARKLFFLLLSIVYIPCCVYGIYLGRGVRMSGMEAFAERSQPLITAIQEYELDHGAPPVALTALVPDYLPAVPNTGMSAYPEYEYFSGDKAREWYAGNPWAISVSTPSGWLNWDMMLYFPKQNYPKHGYGGGLERVGDWAYVHE